MRVFLCIFKDFSVAIPMSWVSSLFIYTEDALNKAALNEAAHNEAVVYNSETQDFLVSLFCLFNIPPQTTKHGIVLKNETYPKKITLLSTQVDSEIEIADSKIYPIPKTLNGMLFSSFFSGIQFPQDTESKPIIILNPEKLIHYIKGKNYD